MATKVLPTKCVLDQLLTYDPASGKLFWKARSAGMFADDGRDAEWKARNWNSKNAGKEAFAVLAPNGYLAGKLGPRRMYAHRIVWRMTHDECPDYLDHINGDRGDNRIVNLRAVTKLQNSRNAQFLPPESGCVGVYWHLRAGKWAASIGLNNTKIHIGLFEDLSEAIAARKQRQNSLGFTERHGSRDGKKGGVGA